jgi:hypothetical protein
MRPLLPIATLFKRMALLLVLPVLMSCEDATDNLFPKAQPVQLPAESQAGANSFGCLVNGQPWEANNTKTLAGSVLTPKITYRDGDVRIDAFRRLEVAGPVTNFTLTAAHVTGPGVYELGLAQPEAGSAARLETSSNGVAYVTDARHRGTLTVTRLDVNGPHPFIAGRFELRAVARDTGIRPADFPAELQVTEGRFDIQLNRR